MGVVVAVSVGGLWVIALMPRQVPIRGVRNLYYRASLSWVVRAVASVYSGSAITAVMLRSSEGSVTKISSLQCPPSKRCPGEASLGQLGI